jgi:dinuclear metal center YbgI/SA1388 family protein
LPFSARVPEIPRLAERLQAEDYDKVFPTYRTVTLLEPAGTGYKMAAAQFLVKDLLTMIDGFAPFALAESWDNVGLMAGDPAQAVCSILVALDPTEDLLREAEVAGANVVLTHHPLIFHPLKSVRLDQPVGRILATAIRKKIHIISCHTNLDVVRNGVSDELAARLGLAASEPLLPLDRVAAVAPMAVGFGRIGDFPGGIAGDEFMARLLAIPEMAAVQMAGHLPERISRAAVCGGSGSTLVETAWRQGAQVFVAGEIKHSEARWAEASGFCVIDAGHYPTENVVVPSMVSLLREALAASGWNIPVRASACQKSPFRSPFTGNQDP